MTPTALYMLYYESLRTWCYSLCRDNELREDLLQECALIVLEYDPVKLSEIAENKYKINSFCYSIVNRQWHSVTSPFYKKYRKRHGLPPETPEPESIEYYCDIVLQNKGGIMDCIDYYDRLLLIKIVECGSMNALSKAAGIPYSSLYVRTKRVTNTIKEEIKRRNEN